MAYMVRVMYVLIVCSAKEIKTRNTNVIIEPKLSQIYIYPLNENTL